VAMPPKEESKNLVPRSQHSGRFTQPLACVNTSFVVGLGQSKWMKKSYYYLSTETVKNSDIKD
jgi:hypothetical protein